MLFYKGLTMIVVTCIKFFFNQTIINIYIYINV